MTALGLLVLGLGAFLIWSAIKNEDPRTVIVRVLTGR